jgi:DNA ligase-associated metallophosphoesterase
MTQSPTELHTPTTLPSVFAGAITRVVGTQTLTFLPQRAVWWEATRTLLVADVHLGKAETLASLGVPAPDGVAAHDLARLSELVAMCGAQRVIVLGDLLHAPAGLTPELVESVRQWRQKHATLELCLVPGNHDRKLHLVAEAWGLRVLGATHAEGGLLLVHDAADSRGDAFGGCTAVLSGHLHPMVVVRGKADRLRLPAFVLSRDAAGRVLGVVLPAWSVFVSGVVLSGMAVSGMGLSSESRDAVELLAIAGERVMSVRV